MTILQPPPSKVAQLTDRWRGQGWRLQAIAEALLAGRDWTAALVGLPFVEEVPSLPGEACGRDLRGAPLSVALKPPLAFAVAGVPDADAVARIILLANGGTGPLRGRAPLAHPVATVAQIAADLAQGAPFVMALLGGRPVGVVRASRQNARGAPGGEISDLAVHPRHQGLGYGGLLLAEAEAGFRTAGLTKARLQAIPETGIVDWYQARDWHVVRTVERCIRGSAAHLVVEMEKALAPALGREDGTKRPLERRPSGDSNA